MRTTKGIPWRMGLCGVVAGAVLLLTATGAHAVYGDDGIPCNADDCKIGTDRAASIVIYPKILVDTSNGIDTVIQLTNASDRRTIDVECFYIRGTGECSNTGLPCLHNVDCGPIGQCLNQICPKRDFRLTLTKRQPVSWRASEGALFLPCDPASPDQETCIRDSNGAQIFNQGSIPQVGDDPFIGELKCVQVDESDAPVSFNSLKGEATIVRVGEGVDVAKYNAIGIQGIPGRQDGNNTLCLGGDGSDACPNGAEYAGCPQTLILDHFFDDAYPTAGVDSRVRSDLTLVPCAENLEDSIAPPSLRTIQFLVFNEFEQRFSTSFRMGCFEERFLSDIDTRVEPFFGGAGLDDDGASIFNVAVQGTASGQTRIRAVSSGDQANGVLGVLLELHECENSPDNVCLAGVNLHQQGRRTLSDIIQKGP